MQSRGQGDGSLYNRAHADSCCVAGANFCLKRSVGATEVQVGLQVLCSVVRRSGIKRFKVGLQALCSVVCVCLSSLAGMAPSAGEPAARDSGSSARWPRVHWRRGSLPTWSSGWLPVPLPDPKTLFMVTFAQKQVCVEKGKQEEKEAAEMNADVDSDSMVPLTYFQRSPALNRELLSLAGAARLVDFSPNGSDFATAAVHLRIFTVCARSRWRS